MKNGELRRGSRIPRIRSSRSRFRSKFWQNRHFWISAFAGPKNASSSLARTGAIFIDAIDAITRARFKQEREREMKKSAEGIREWRRMRTLVLRHDAIHRVRSPHPISSSEPRDRKFTRARIDLLSALFALLNAVPIDDIVIR